MAQVQITLNEQLLHQLFLGDAKSSGMNALLEAIFNQVLKAQASEQLKVEKYERSNVRTDYRNGSYPRQLKTRVGKLTLNVPRLRNGHFSTDLFNRYQRSEQALVLSLMEMVINGVSTRRVSQITEELCGTEFSKTTVSDLCGRLDPIVSGWNNRPLEGNYPFLIVDAVYTKVRENGRVRSRGVLVSYGINDQGYRTILGLKVDDSESTDAWKNYFDWLKARGLKGVDVVVSDDHGGLVKAVQKAFQGATWQRCQAHFLRNVHDRLPKSLKREGTEQVKAILQAPNVQTSQTLLQSFLETYQEKVPRVTKLVEAAFDDVTAVLTLPEPYRRRLRTTNGMERLNEEFRRRERVIRIFPNRESIIRIMGSLLMEQDEKWSSRCYLKMDEYFSWKAKQHKSAKSSKVTMIYPS
ncbi:IS256 family transposase [Sporolactobacillus inulinus]|jgi:transposase-like protein|uniref:Mutator family transposase n=1 Tax=Sporolactobacillus inulinus CASD TaxID=1069536 RepID=A0A0U1QPS1_9BACL|nr:IS256 family transposase [Sporolactobacillus inulinus]KLI02772.1 transposase [Sporolactobacillus inulinus CASD]GEB78566.1 IS256 family transposase [Sporolactobacillus inulinus]